MNKMHLLHKIIFPSLYTEWGKGGLKYNSNGLKHSSYFQCSLPELHISCLAVQGNRWNFFLLPAKQHLLIQLPFSNGYNHNPKWHMQWEQLTTFPLSSTSFLEMLCLISSTVVREANRSPLRQISDSHLPHRHPHPLHLFYCFAFV